jgi:hypothetical protein
MSQIPHADDNGLCCPLWQKPMKKVCHTCPWWIAVRGVERNTGAEVDQWRCAVAVLPHLLVENAHQTRGAAAATEGLRNIVAKGISNRPREHELDLSVARIK